MACRACGGASASRIAAAKSCNTDITVYGCRSESENCYGEQVQGKPSLIAYTSACVDKMKPMAEAVSQDQTKAMCKYTFKIRATSSTLETAAWMYVVHRGQKFHLCKKPYYDTIDNPKWIFMETQGP